MKLSDLPTMLVERVERVGERLQIEGRFDRLDGVPETGCFRLRRCDYAWANLEIIDRDGSSVRVTDERDSGIQQLRVGERYIGLNDYWQMPLIEAIADESTVWRRFTFAASEATYYRMGDSIMWQESGLEVPEGAVEIGTNPGGWDHEHCGLCDGHIDDESPIAYETDNWFLCSVCYERYGATHDLSFLMRA